MKARRRRGARALGAAWLALLASGCAGSEGLRDNVPELSERRVWRPVRLGWVSSERPSGALPGAIALGGPGSGRVLVYLEFPEPQRGRKLVRAQLWLSTTGPSEPIDVELSRAGAAGPQLVTWSDRPLARYPSVSAKLGGGAGRQSLDVSELLSAPAAVGEPLRVLLRAEPDGAEPVLLETGADGGSAPRLELYWL